VCYNPAISGKGFCVRSAFFVAAACVATRIFAGTVSGRVEVKEKGGRTASDLSEVVVWVDGAKGKPPTPSRARVVMKGKAFNPHVVVITVGGTVEFPNEDPIFHNVFSVSGDNRFDLDLYKRPKSGSWTFQRPGIVRVYCNIHPQMSAVVVVRDNPYFVKAGEDGSFTIDGVPSGRYALRAWHERGGDGQLELNVPAEGSVGAQLLLDASTFKRDQHKNKFGKDYSTDEKY
jgi:plastocyanin